MAGISETTNFFPCWVSNRGATSRQRASALLKSKGYYSNVSLPRLPIMTPVAEKSRSVRIGYSICVPVTSGYHMVVLVSMSRVFYIRREGDNSSFFFLLPQDSI
jgi:hypothetical protein